MTDLMDFSSVRPLLEASGDDRVKFLQGLATCDVAQAGMGVLRPAAFLTPQGRIKALVFLTADAERIVIHGFKEDADSLMRLLRMHRLRSQVDITPARELSSRAALPSVARVLFAQPQMARFNLLAYEANLDLCGGISWDKGCYIGQEVTARIKYRGLEKKRARGFVWEHTPIAQAESLSDATFLDETGREIGEILTCAHDAMKLKGVILARKEFWEARQARGVRQGFRTGILTLFNKFPQSLGQRL